MHELNITKDYNYAFLNCYRTVIKQNINLLNDIKTAEERYSLIESLFYKNLKIKLEPQRPSTWEKMVFQSDKDKTLFLLKWQQ